ncbi:MAG: hypothetical protein WBS24_17475 [Terriglobales bacterium]
MLNVWAMEALTDFYRDPTHPLRGVEGIAAANLVTKQAGIGNESAANENPRHW